MDLNSDLLDENSVFILPDHPSPTFSSPTSNLNNLWALFWWGQAGFYATTMLVLLMIICPHWQIQKTFTCNDQPGCEVQIVLFFNFFHFPAAALKHHPRFNRKGADSVWIRPEKLSQLHIGCVCVCVCVLQYGLILFTWWYYWVNPWTAI